MTNPPKSKAWLRKSSAALALSTAGLLVLTACTPGGDGEPTEAGVGEPATSVVLGTTSKLGTTNPLDQTWTSYVFSVFDGLLDWGSMDPALAEEWENPTPDTLTFTVRDDATFHDGTPVTAQDVAFSINLVDQEKFAFSQNLDTFESVAADGNEVTITFDQPDPLGLQKIGQVPVIPEAYWNEVGLEGFVAEPIGSGPFEVVDYSPGASVSMERYDEYWGEAARTESVVLQFFTDAQALESAFESGQIQVAHALPSSSIPQLEGNEEFEVTAGYVGGTIMLQINTTQAPFDDPNLREAANLAVDQAGLSAALDYGSTEAEAGQVTYEGVLGYRDDIEAVEQDMAEAQRLVEASNYDGTEVNIVGMAVRKDLFEGIAAQLREAGFTVKVETLDVPVWLEQFRGGSDSDIFQRGVSYQGINDAARAYRWFTWSAKPFVKDQEWISLWNAINTEMDADKRGDLLREATGMVRDENYVLFTSSTPSVNATVHGVDGITWLNPAMDFRQVQWIPAE